MLIKFYKTALVFLFSICTVCAIAGTKQWNYFSSQAGGKKDVTSVSLLSSSASETELSFTMDGFSQAAVTTPNGNAFVISSSKLTRILEAGAPDLGKMAFSVAIPDH